MDSVSYLYLTIFLAFVIMLVIKIRKRRKEGKKMIPPVFHSIIQSPGDTIAYSCAFPLDASEIEISSRFTNGYQLDMSPDLQTGQYVIQSQLPDFETYAAYAEGLYEDEPTSYLDCSVIGEIRAIEFQLQQIDMPTNGGEIWIEVSLMPPTQFTAHGFRITLKGDGTFDLEGRTGHPGTMIQGGTTLPSVISYVTDRVNGTRYWLVDGEKYLILTGSLASASPVMYVREQAGVGAGDAGKVIRIRTETSAEAMTNNYDLGTRDACGTEIAYNPVPLDPNTGVVWQGQSASSFSEWYGLAYGESTFVAVANSGANQVMTSPDAITWTTRTAAEANGWRKVAYGNGVFAAVAASGTNRVMTSSDGGATWVARSIPEANAWYGITYGNGLFVAVAGSGTNRIMTSPDGITWTGVTAPEARLWTGVTYGMGLFVAVSQTGHIMTSPDGSVWTMRTSPELNNWNDVTYGNGRFVAVASSGTNRTMTSTNGITWTASPAVEASSWRSVGYGKGLFVAVSRDGTDRVMTSTDGSSWTAQTAAEATTWEDVMFAEDMFVSVSRGGTNQVMVSPPQ